MTNREKAQQHANEMFGADDKIGLAQLAYDITMKTARWKRNQMIQRMCKYLQKCDELTVADRELFIKRFKKEMEFDL